MNAADILKYGHRTILSRSQIWLGGQKNVGSLVAAWIFEK
jgi:hypothetical protein